MGKWFSVSFVFFIIIYLWLYNFRDGWYDYLVEWKLLERCGRLCGDGSEFILILSDFWCYLNFIFGFYMCRFD